MAYPKEGTVIIMLKTALYILLGIFMFGIIIFIHELGHFLTAKAFKVGINEFAIGMGPKLFSKKGKDGVLYSLRLIPMGGYVSMVGEDEDSDDENAYCNKKVWQRIIIVAAGAVMNIILGVLLIGLITCFTKEIYSTTIEGFNVVDENGDYVYYEEINGLRIGDTVLKVGKRNIHIREDLLYEVMMLSDEETDITVLRDGEMTVVPGIKFHTITENGITLGNAGYIRMTKLDKNIITVTKQAIYESAATLKMLWATIVNTVKGKYGTKALSGPVGVIEQVQETASYGFDSLMFLMAIITLNVGIFNLLPLPALDGGRLFFMLIELIIGRPVNPKYEGYVHAVGMILLLGLMVFVTYNDIVRIFTK